MKHQVFVIHGGDAFATYEDYLSDLRLQAVDIQRVGFKDWKSTLGETLGDDFEVIAPRMPNAQNAHYEEWKIWLEKFLPFLRDGVILVGHSLGGIFLAKYLVEEKFPLTIAATFLVAAPYNTAQENMLGDFIVPSGTLDKLANQGGRVFLYHSQDDMVVPFSDLAKYQQVLPNATVREFIDKQHFNQAELPEIVADIQSI